MAHGRAGHQGCGGGGGGSGGSSSSSNGMAHVVVMPGSDDEPIRVREVN
jgi:hypothetical protein